MKRTVFRAVAAILLLLLGVSMLSSCTFLRLIGSQMDPDEEEIEGGKNNGVADVFLYEEYDGGYQITGLQDPNADLIVLTIPETINGREVVAIAPEAFRENGRIEHVRLPQSVEEIGERAFYSCEALREVDFHEDGVEEIGSEAFADCSSLSISILPPSLESIGAGAFRGCTQLLAIAIPGSVAVIEEETFLACERLHTVILKEGTNSIDERAFCGCKSLIALDLPSSVTSIAPSAFAECTSLVAVILPSGLEELEACVFRGCTALVTVVLPSGLTSIGESAFEGCTALPLISLPGTLSIIRENAFFGCSSLASIALPRLPDGVRSGAFCDCTSLRMVYLLSGERPDGFEMNHAYNGSLQVSTSHREHTMKRVDSVESTCTVRGWTKNACTTCGYSAYSFTELVAHRMDGNICQVCGVLGDPNLNDGAEIPAESGTDPAESETSGSSPAVTSKPSTTAKPSVTTRPADPETDPITEPVTEPITEPVTTTLEDLYGAAPAGYEWFEFYDIVLLVPSGWRMSNMTGGKQFRESSTSNYTMAVAREDADLFDYYTMSDAEYEEMLNYAFQVQGLTGARADVTSFTHTVRGGYKVTRAAITVTGTGATAYEIQYMIEIGGYNYSIIFGNVTNPDEIAVTVYEHLIVLN